MPQILVVTDSTDAGTVVYREWVAATDLESAHFAGQLVERVGWAVRDANLLERDESSLSRAGEKGDGDRRDPRGRHLPRAP